MPQKMILLSTRDSDKATVTASSQIATLPVQNVQDQEPTKVWRTGGGGFYVDFTLATAIAVNAGAFTWPYGALSSNANVTLYGYTSAANMASHTPVINSSNTSVWAGGVKHTDPDWGPEVGLVQIPTSVTAYRYWRLWFNDSTPPGGVCDIGRATVGKAIQFKINPRIDGSMGYVPLDVQEANGYGQIFTDPRPYAQRQFELVWSTLDNKSLLEDISEIVRLRGQAGDVYVFLQPDELTYFHKTSMQALFEGPQKFIPQQTFILDANGVARASWAFTTTLTQKL